MMNDLTGMEGRKLRMPSVSPLRVVGRVTGRQRGWALGINTIPFHFPASAFPVEMATPQPYNVSSVWAQAAMTVCNSLLRGVCILGWIQVVRLWEAAGGKTMGIKDAEDIRLCWKSYLCPCYRYVIFYICTITHNKNKIIKEAVTLRLARWRNC